MKVVHINNQLIERERKAKERDAEISELSKILVAKWNRKIKAKVDKEYGIDPTDSEK